MTKVDDGGPAFPGEKETRFGQHNDCNEGMSLRDWFAGQALVGLIAEHAHPTAGGSWGHLEGISGKAFEFADEMLRARREGSEQS